MGLVQGNYVLRSYSKTLSEEISSSTVCSTCLHFLHGLVYSQVQGIGVHHSLSRGQMLLSSCIFKQLFLCLVGDFTTHECLTQELAIMVLPWHCYTTFLNHKLSHDRSFLYLQNSKTLSPFYPQRLRTYMQRTLGCCRHLAAIDPGCPKKWPLNLRASEPWDQTIDIQKKRHPSWWLGRNGNFTGI